MSQSLTGYRWMLLLALPLALQASDLERQAYEILKKNCFACHGAVKASGLDLRTRESMLSGGGRGPAVEPMNARRSLLYQFVALNEKPAMPPEGKLAAADLETLNRWIEAGALLDSVKEAQPAGQDNAADLAKLEERPITPAERDYWAFRAPKRTAPPQVADAGRKANPVDAFLLSAMRARGLRPSPQADRRTLIRRAYLDLIGLPPTPQEVEAFVKDSSPGAWEVVVERLLASPHYGERWARYWLDLVRFADSGGFERDFDWPNAWRYRDYVVQAFNQDMPYERFIREQLAGDEYEPATDQAMIATGYLRLGMDNNIKDARTRLDELDDLVSTTSLTFLGMTVGCARCHNHKFDPIPQKDYYRMQAVFVSTKGIEHPLVPESVVEAHRVETKRVRGLQEPARKARAELEEPHRKRLFEERLSGLPDYVQAAWRTPPERRNEGQRLNAIQIEKTLIVTSQQVFAVLPAEEREEHRKLTSEIEQIEKQLPAPFPSARATRDAGRDPLPSYFLHRGNPDAKGTRMPPGALTVASHAPYVFPSPSAGAASTWRRRGLAEWIASPANPLTARVMVNRIWQHHFGEGIVRTPSNFGKTGPPPSHPELLDWLAVEFMERGWSIKHMHRLMMTSEAYRMASDDSRANLAADPENRYFWRMPRRRLEAEILRDQILAVAGTLDRGAGGPAVHPYIDPDLFQSSTSRTWPGKPDEDPSTWRRSIYVFSKRSIRYPLFETFDQPDMVASCDRRNRSTIATQALLLMNSGFVMLHARKFAERLRKEAGESLDAQVERAYQLALGRSPDAFERERSAAYIRATRRGLADFCQALFSLNEFAYRQ
jgi:mono/diheme cytochrome c family protein